LRGEARGPCRRCIGGSFSARCCDFYRQGHDRHSGKRVRHDAVSEESSGCPIERRHAPEVRGSTRAVRLDAPEQTLRDTRSRSRLTSVVPVSD